MMNRTDLALELKEEQTKKKTKLKGVYVKTRIDTASHIKETKITIKNEEGAKALGKPIGTYVTLETKDMAQNDHGFHQEMSLALASALKEMVGSVKDIMVAGLGNAQVSADALGPKVVDNLWVTRHLETGRNLCAIAPGVMAQTGIETSDILSAVVNLVNPEVLFVVDALAARTSKRLNRTIQLSDTGITPGSGVGNHRHEITKDSMGIPVIAIGVPTVISVPAILNDCIKEWDVDETYEQMPKELLSMHVTPKNIDEAMKRISFTLSEGINRLVHIG